MPLSHGERKIKRHCAEDYPWSFLIFFRFEQIFGDQIRNFLFVKLKKTNQIHFLDDLQINNAVFQKLTLPLIEKLLKH